MSQQQHQRLLPWPRHLEPRPGVLAITARTRIVAGEGVEPGDHLVVHLVADIQRATGLHLTTTSDAGGIGDLVLQLDGDPSDHGAEGYELTIDTDGVVVRAATEHGLWHGTRTLVQLFPDIDDEHVLGAVYIVDSPRFEWRGAMLDVARHFFGVDHVLRFIELIARFRLNRLHLHLTDDQGWRIEIEGWPALTNFGGSTCVGGGPGGWFSRDEYREIVAHAARHFVTIVPEVDMPGHTNAALASVPELNIDGVAPPLYTGKDVGFSSLHLDAPATRDFLHAMIRQLAADTPGDYLHIGGDEAHSTDRADYIEFVEVLQREIQASGKQMIGWEEIASASLTSGTIVQHWLRPETALGTSVARYVMSPAQHAYLDMKHTPACPVGRRWAGFIDVDTAYNWDPASLLVGVDDDGIAGVEAPLWTEKVVTFADVEYLTFPRLACIAEVGWTPQADRDWDSFRPRLGLQVQRLAEQGVHVFRSTLLD